MIDVKNLTHIYPSGKGIFDVSFSVEEGEFFGYLGPNGAGKTTTLRHLMGFATPSKGHATIAGINCQKDAHKLQNDVGYLAGEMTFSNHMSGDEFLDLIQGMRGKKNGHRRQQLLKDFELDVNGKIKKMSKGMKQKLGIVTAFMHDPSIYILDEPTSGLDPLMQKVFMALIEDEKKRGKTIIMSSHIIEEVSLSCHRAGIIRDGYLVETTDITSLNQMSDSGYEVVFGNERDIEKVGGGGFDYKIINDLTYYIKASYPYDKLFELLSTCDVKSLKPKQNTLEDVFLKYYHKEGDNND